MLIRLTRVLFFSPLVAVKFNKFIFSYSIGFSSTICEQVYSWGFFSPPRKVIHIPFNELLSKILYHKHSCLTAFLQIGCTVSKMKLHFAYLNNLPSSCILLEKPSFQMRFIMEGCSLYRWWHEKNRLLKLLLFIGQSLCFHI